MSGCLVQVLDAALTRPGRLSRRVIVPLPNEVGRASIMAVHLRNTPMRSLEVKQDACQIVARISGGMSGAELASVCNEGALLAGRRSAEVGVDPPYSNIPWLQLYHADWHDSHLISSIYCCWSPDGPPFLKSYGRQISGPKKFPFTHLRQGPLAKSIMWSNGPLQLCAKTCKAQAWTKWGIICGI